MHLREKALTIFEAFAAEIQDRSIGSQVFHMLPSDVSTFCLIFHEFYFA